MNGGMGRWRLREKQGPSAESLSKSVAMNELESRPLVRPALPSGAGKAKASCTIWLLSAKVSYFHGLHQVSPGTERG